MNFIPIDDLVQVWVEVHEELREMRVAARDTDLSWWREAIANLCPPPPEGDVIVEDEDA